MDKKLFKRLVESMGQMDEIVRGVRAPSREFYVDAVSINTLAAPGRALAGPLAPRNWPLT